MESKKEDLIQGVVNEIRSYAYYGIKQSNWLCFIGQNSTCFLKVNSVYGEEFSWGIDSWAVSDRIELDKISKKYVNHNINSLNELPNKKIFIDNLNNIGYILYKKNLILCDKIKYTSETDNLTFHLYRKQFNIIQGVLNKKIDFQTAFTSSGPDYAKIKFWLLVTIILAASFFALIVIYF